MTIEYIDNIIRSREITTYNCFIIDIMYVQANKFNSLLYLSDENLLMKHYLMFLPL